MDATLWQHLAASLTRIVVALLAAVLIGVPVGIDGAEPDGARHPRSAD
jgi:ABC-type nitrate/sulfonate/bicarbonate transport system permease component